LGTLINVVAIVIGSTFGLVFHASLSQRILSTVMQAVAIFVMFIGLQMTFSADFTAISRFFIIDGILVVLVCLVVGAIIGSLLDLESRLDVLGRAIEAKFSHSSGDQQAGSGLFAKGFVVASLLFCVGPMAVVGAISDALLGDVTTLSTKAVLDGVASIALASTLGVGVLFSAAAVLLYQGAITLLASVLQSVLSDPVIQVMQGVGGLLVFGIGINLLGVAKVRVGDLLPALFVVFVLIAVRAVAFSVVPV